MTTSKKDLNLDLDNAIRMLMEELGEGWFAVLSVDSDNPPNDNELPTTWSEMTRRGLIEDVGFKHYGSTAQAGFMALNCSICRTNRAFAKRC